MVATSRVCIDVGRWIAMYLHVQSRFGARLPVRGRLAEQLLWQGLLVICAGGVDLL